MTAKHVLRTVPRRRLVALGGGGFMMEHRWTAIDDELVQLTGRARPRVCFVPTPTGDDPELIERFHTIFEVHAESWQLAPFRKPTARSVPLDDLDRMAAFDLIFVSGGNTRSALAVWREWGIDRALRRAFDRGVLIAGVSAGAICWFERGWTDSSGAGYRALPGLGWIDGGCSPHHASDSERETTLRAAIVDGSMPRTLVIDDGAAVRWTDGAVDAVYAWWDGAGARYLERDEGGGVRSTSLSASTIEWAMPADPTARPPAR